MAVYKDHSLAEIVSICVTLSSVVNDIYFTLDGTGTGPETRLATITSMGRHLASNYVLH
jgi:hypothetical protein